MRRILRILLNSATAFSLLLCIVVAAAWVATLWRSDVWTFFYFPKYYLEPRLAQFPVPPHFRFVVVQLGNGTDGVGITCVLRRQTAAMPTARFDINHGAYRRGKLDFLWTGGSPPRIAGFAFAHGRWLADRSAVVRSDAWEIGLPHWFLVGVAAGLPAVRLSTWRRRRRQTRRVAARLCPACGYDLRATPDKCPECGQAPANR